MKIKDDKPTHYQRNTKKKKKKKKKKKSKIKQLLLAKVV